MNNLYLSGLLKIKKSFFILSTSFFFTILLLIFPLMVMAQVAPSPVYPVKVSSSGRYLVDQNNQPVFWSGDSPWAIIAEGTKADMDFYLANRQQKGFNVILVNLIEHMFATNAPRNINGDPPFTGTNFSTPNEAYFAQADYLVSQAGLKGMTVLLNPLYLGYGCGSEGWCNEVQVASSADMQSWGSYVGNRYKNFDNIVWVIGGDMDPTPVAGKVTAFVNGLQAADNRHLITAHNVRGQMAVTPWSGASWLTLNSTYSTYAQSYAQAQTAYNLSPAKPFFQIEGWYENEHSMTNPQLRAQAYWTILAGGTGYMFGDCPLWGLGAPASSFCQTNVSDWKTTLDKPGSISMQHVQELFRPKAWYDLVPDWNHSVLTAGFGTFGNTDYVTAGRTTDGSLVLAYLPTTRTVTVDMTKLSGPVNAKWYDPADGTYSAISGSPLANTGLTEFTPIGNNSGGDGDWILVLEASAQPSPSPTPTIAPSPSPTPVQSPSPSPTPTITPSPSPTPVPTPSSTPIPTPVPSPTPTPTPTPTPVPTPSPTPTPTPTPTPVPTPTPNPFCIPGDTSFCVSPIHFWKLNENSGTAVADSGTNPVSGILKNGPTWTAGKYSSALLFNGINRYVSVGNTHLNGLAKVTFEGWFKRKVANSIVSVGEEVNPTKDASIEMYSDGLVYMNIGTGTTVSYGGFNSNDTNWHHVSFVFDGTKTGNTNRLKGYLDGVQKTLNFYGTTIPSSIYTNDSNFSIGALSGNHGFTNGTIDDVRIYNYVRTPQQISRDMNNP